MPKLYLWICGVLLTFTAFAAVQTVSSFTAIYQGTEVHLEWRVDNESDVQVYELSRKRPEETSYTRLINVAPNGSGQYSFNDEMLKESSQSALTYRLVARTGQTSNTYFATLSSGPTAVQRSWGSIKSMFK